MHFEQHIHLFLIFTLILSEKSNIQHKEGMWIFENIMDQIYLEVYQTSYNTDSTIYLANLILINLK